MAKAFLRPIEDAIENRTNSSIVIEKEVIVEVEKPIEVIKEIIVEKPVEIIKEVIIEKPVEVIKEIEKKVEVPVIIEKPVEIIKEIIVEKEVPKVVEIKDFSLKQELNRLKLTNKFLLGFSILLFILLLLK